MVIAPILGKMVDLFVFWSVGAFGGAAAVMGYLTIRRHFGQSEEDKLAIGEEKK